MLLRFKALEDRAVAHRVGVVTVASPLAVALGGASVAYTDCKRLSSYAPTVGDKVSVLTVGADLIVLGLVV